MIKKEKMKRLNQILLTVLFVCSVIACSSDDDVIEEINETFINGTWQLSETTKNGSAITLSECEKTNTLQFSNSNNEVAIVNHEIINENCEITESITVSYVINNNVIEFNGINYKILTLLENNTLRLEFEEGSNTIVNTLNRQ